jgi:prepilin-type N-terminal cleavage/methylation domain-containing protein
MKKSSRQLNPIKLERGMTIVEVLVAVVILSIVLVAFAGVIVGNIRQNATSGNRTAAAQVLNYLGRRAAEGQAAVLPAVGGSSRIWNYGTLNREFPELKQERNAANSDLYRAEIIDQGSPAWSTAKVASLVSYQINVCWKDAGKESCVSAQTIAPELVKPVDFEPIIPGMN